MTLPSPPYSHGSLIRRHRPAAGPGRVATFLLLATALGCAGPDSDRVLVLVNANSPVSLAVGRAYAEHRNLASDRVLALDLATPDPTLSDDRHERIGPAGFEESIAAPLRNWLAEHDPGSEVDILVTTKGVPLMIDAPAVPPREWIRSYEGRSVDAELAVLDGPLASKPGLQGQANPFFDLPRSFAEYRERRPERKLRFLVARLTAFQAPVADRDDIPADIVKLLAASTAEIAPGDTGRYLIDHDPSLPTAMSAGNLLLLAPTAAALRAQGLEVIEDEADAFAGGAEALRGYVSWGSNDSNEPTRRTYGEHEGVSYPGHFAPRGIASDLVSTNARSFTAPAEYGQSLAADLLHMGAAGATGHVAEPTLGAVARPYILLPRYAAGELAIEAYYKSLPYLGWTHVYVGDPLMRLPEEQTKPIPLDRDGDGVVDTTDNCTHIPNRTQRDTDGDGIGNVCDADVDGNGLVTTSFGRIFPVEDRGDVEWIALTARNGPYDPDHDLDGDGAVDERDVSMAQLGLFRPPGPTARVPGKATIAAQADGP